MLVNLNDVLRDAQKMDMALVFLIQRIVICLRLQFLLPRSFILQ